MRTAFLKRAAHIPRGSEVVVGSWVPYRNAEGEEERGAGRGAGRWEGEHLEEGRLKSWLHGLGQNTALPNFLGTLILSICIESRARSM